METIKLVFLDGTGIPAFIRSGSYSKSLALRPDTMFQSSLFTKLNSAIPAVRLQPHFHFGFRTDVTMPSFALNEL
jgi:hypothetical protein